MVAASIGKLEDVHILEDTVFIQLVAQCLCCMQREAEGAENGLLVGGVIVLLLSAAATSVAQAVYAHRLKQR